MANNKMSLNGSSHGAYRFLFSSRMLTTSSSSTRRKDNCHSLSSTASRPAIRQPSLRNCHRSLTRTSTPDWPRNRKTFLMPWSRWSRITWLSSSCRGEQRTQQRWSAATRSTSSSRWAARFPTQSWASSSGSTMDIGWVSTCCSNDRLSLKLSFPISL